MSVKQIESEIAKLTSSERQELSTWMERFYFSVTPKSRPRVGDITSAPIVYSEDCFAPLTEQEIEQWGFV